MLFYLTDSLIVEEGDAEIRDIYLALRNIVGAAYGSKHMLLGDLKVLEWFADRLGNDPIKGVLINLISNYSMAVLPIGIKEYIKVERTSQNEIVELQGSSDVRIHRVCYKRFIKSDSVNRTHIIGEDLNDAKLYFGIGNWYLRYMGYPIHMDYTPEGGNGNNIASISEKFINQGEIVVTITETDQRYPGGPKGQTCSGCLNYNFPHPFGELLVIDAHEVENIIPISIIRQMNLSGFNHYESIHLNLNPRSNLRYYDIKKGCRYDEKYKENQAYLDFYTDICKANQNCNVDDFEEWHNTHNKGDSVFGGLGTTILKNAVEYMQVNGNKISYDFLPFQQKEWERIGQTILNKCIARRPEALNL